MHNPKKLIRTSLGKIEKTRRTELMKEPRRCIVCAITKEAKDFCKHAVYVCERCFETR